MAASPFCPPCPVPLLLSDVSDVSDASGRPEEVLARVLAVAAEGGGRSGLVGEVLVHLLSHDFHTRPAVARAIVTYAPEQVPVAVERMSLYHRNRYRDPQVQASAHRVVDPQAWEPINRLVTLAYLDRAWLDEAQAEYATAEVTALLFAHNEFAGLGEEQGRLALARMAEQADRNDRLAGSMARDMVLLPPELHEQVRAVLDRLLGRGLALGVLSSTPSSLDRAYQPHVVHVALASLRMDPGRFLTAGHQDAVAAVLAAGPRFQGELLRTLWDLVRDEQLRLVFRRRAAKRLGDVGAAEPAAAQEWLARSLREAASAEAVASTEARLRAEVTEVWARIEAYLAEHTPGVLEALVGPASAEEIASAEQRFGMRLPADFAASCARHRSIHLGGVLGFDVEHEDFAALAVASGIPADEPYHDEDGDVRWSDDWRAGWLTLSYEPDGSITALDLDPGPDGVRGQVIHADQGIPQRACVKSANWLALLRTFAERLEAGQYLYLADRRALTDKDS